MSRLHASFVFGILGLVACGGGSSTPDAAKPIDAKAIDAVVQPDGGVAMGTKHHFVVNKQFLPQNNTESRNYGLDLNGDGVIDNQFGMVIGTFAGQGINTQASVDTAIAKGTTIILATLQTTDFTSASGAGFMTYKGANPSPAPCTNTNDTVCGHHLTGSGTFDIAASTPMDPLLVGNFASGTMSTPVGVASMPLPLAFGGTMFTVELIGARVQVTAASATGLTAILAGAIPSSQMDTKVYPAMQTGFMAEIARDCTALTSPPTCGCTSGSAGAQDISLLDTNPTDCAITVMEIKSNSLISALFAPDVTIDGQMGLSVGVKVTAVGATFTGP